MMEKTSYGLQINCGSRSIHMKLTGPIGPLGLSALDNYSQLLGKSSSIVYEEMKCVLLSGTSTGSLAG